MTPDDLHFPETSRGQQRPLSPTLRSGSWGGGGCRHQPSFVFAADLCQATPLRTRRPRPLMPVHWADCTRISHRSRGISAAPTLSGHPPKVGHWRGLEIMKAGVSTGASAGRTGLFLGFSMKRKAKSAVCGFHCPHAVPGLNWHRMLLPSPCSTCGTHLGTGLPAATAQPPSRETGGTGTTWGSRKRSHRLCFLLAALPRRSFTQTRVMSTIPPSLGLGGDSRSQGPPPPPTQQRTAKLSPGDKGQVPENEEPHPALLTAVGGGREV